MCVRVCVGWRLERTIVIEPKQDSQQKGKWDGEEDVTDRNVPEMDEPASFRDSRFKRNASRESFNLDLPHPANVHEGGEEYQG